MRRSQERMRGLKEVRIEFASPDEASRIAEILGAAFAEFEGFYTPEAFAATVLNSDEIRKRFEEEGAIWTARKNGEIAGTVSVVPDGEKLYVRSMAVLPSAQGLGIAQKLLETVEEFAIENEFESLFLYTTPFLLSAIRLYKINGFKRGEEVDWFFGTPLFEMDKKLKC